MQADLNRRAKRSDVLYGGNSTLNSSKNIKICQTFTKNIWFLSSDSTKKQVNHIIGTKYKILVVHSTISAKCFVLKLLWAVRMAIESLNHEKLCFIILYASINRVSQFLKSRRAIFPLSPLLVNYFLWLILTASSTAQLCTPLHCSSLHLAAQDYIEHHCTVLHCTTLHCIPLHCSAMLGSERTSGFYSEKKWERGGECTQG